MQHYHTICKPSLSLQMSWLQQGTMYMKICWPGNDFFWVVKSYQVSWGKKFNAPQSFCLSRCVRILRWEYYSIILIILIEWCTIIDSHEIAKMKNWWNTVLIRFYTSIKNTLIFTQMTFFNTHYYPYWLSLEKCIWRASHTSGTASKRAAPGKSSLESCSIVHFFSNKHTLLLLQHLLECPYYSTQQGNKLKFQQYPVAHNYYTNRKCLSSLKPLLETTVCYFTNSALLSTRVILLIRGI